MELHITRINMIGPPGSGKTCTQKLLLGEPPPPPEAVTDSTPIARSAIQATLASSVGSGSNGIQLEKVGREELLKKLVNHLRHEETNKKTTTNTDTQQQLPPKKDQDTKPQDDTDQSKLESDDADDDDTSQPEQQDDMTDTKDSEMIKEIVYTLQNSEACKFHQEWVYIIDTGGQPAYQELLPLFAQKPGINIITIDLSKGLDKKIDVKYRMNGKIYQVDETMKLTNEELVKSIVKTGDTYMDFPKPSGIIIEIPSFPMYLVLGTHYDKFSKLHAEVEKELKMMENKHLLKRLHKDEFKQCIIWEDDHIIHPINAIHEKPERENARKNLCAKLFYRNAGAMKIKNMPIRWFAFLLYLQDLVTERPFLTWDEVLKAGRELQMKSVESALTFFHNASIFLYYNDCPELKHLIFVNPQCILEPLSMLIALSYLNDDNIREYTLDSGKPLKQPSIIRTQLKEEGVFSVDLLKSLKITIDMPDDKKFEVFSSDHFKPEHFISLLEHLHIVFKKNGRETFFLPCALCSYHSTEIAIHPARATELKPLLIVWQAKVQCNSSNSDSSSNHSTSDDNSGDDDDTMDVSVPQGVFPLTVINMLQTKKVRLSKDKTYRYRYRDAMSLTIKEKAVTLHMINHYSHIEVFLSGDEALNDCCDIRTTLSKAIDKSCEIAHVKASTYKFAFQCPSEKEGCFCVVEKDRTKAYCTKCTQSNNSIAIIENPQCSHWFKDELQKKEGERIIIIVCLIIFINS